MGIHLLVEAENESTLLIMDPDLKFLSAEVMTERATAHFMSEVSCWGGLLKGQHEWQARS